MSRAAASVVERQIAAAAKLSDAELFELHRAVCRLAGLARLRDPEYVQRQHVGYVVAREKMRAGRARSRRAAAAQEWAARSL